MNKFKELTVYCKDKSTGTQYFVDAKLSFVEGFVSVITESNGTLHYFPNEELLRVTCKGLLKR